MKVKDKYLNFYYETMGEVEEPKIDPKKTALLIVDMQNEFILRDFGEALAFKEAGKDGFLSMTDLMKLQFQTM